MESVPTLEIPSVVDVRCFNFPSPEVQDDFCNYRSLKISLISDKYDSVWKNIFEFFERNNSSNGDEINLLVTYTLNIIEHSFKYETRIPCSYFFSYISLLLKNIHNNNNNNRNLFDDDLLTTLADISILALSKDSQNSNNNSENIAVNLLRYFVNSILLETDEIENNQNIKISKSVSNKIGRIANYLTGIRFKTDRTIDDLNLLTRTLIESDRLLKSTKGKDIVVAVLSIHPELLTFTRNWYVEFFKIDKPLIAVRFANIIYRVWQSASKNSNSNNNNSHNHIVTKKFVEKEFLSYFARLGLESTLVRTPLRKNIYRVLNHWHKLRKNQFSRAITESYEELIYAYVRTNVYHYRYNALLLLTNAYPLVKPRSSLVVHSDCLLRQHEAFLTLLADEHPTIRCVAIKRIGRRMKEMPISFANGSDEKILETLIDKLIRDLKSEQVRTAALNVLADLVNVVLYRDLFNVLLVRIKGNRFCRERSERARTAFIKLLTNIDQQRDNIRVRPKNIVDCKTIFKLLHGETSKNAKRLIKLVCRSIYSIDPNKTPEIFDASERILSMLEINPLCAEIFATGLIGLLSLKAATDIIRALLLFLKKSIKNNSVNEQSLDLIDRFVSDRSSLFEKTDNVCAILQFVTTLCNGFKIVLNRPENNDTKVKLTEVCTKIIPPLLLRYKDGEIFYAIIRLATVVPTIKLYNSTTLIGKCTSILRTFSYSDNDNNNNNDNDCLNRVSRVVDFLVTINRGAEVLDLIMEYIDNGLRDIIRRESIRKSIKRVKFDLPLADNRENCLIIFDILSRNNIILTYLRKRNQKEMSDFFQYLKSTVQRWIGNKLNKDNASITNGDNDFLNKLFYIYLQLPLLFHAYEYDLPETNLIRITNDIVNWFEIDILSKRFDSDHELIVDSIESLMKTTVNVCSMIAAVPRSVLIKWIKLSLSACNDADGKFVARFIEYLTQIVFCLSMGLYTMTEDDYRSPSTSICIEYVINAAKIAAKFLRNNKNANYDANVNLTNVIVNYRNACRHLIDAIDCSLYDTLAEEMCFTCLTIYYDRCCLKSDDNNYTNNNNDDNDKMIIPLANKMKQLPFIVSEICSILLLDNRLSGTMMLAISKFIVKVSNERLFVSALSLSYTLLSNMRFDRKNLKILLTYANGIVDRRNLNDFLFVVKSDDSNDEKRWNVHQLLHYLLRQCSTSNL